MDVPSIEASTRECVRSFSSSSNAPLTLANCPLTFEIIMCFALNSATEWTGSMFQVVVPVWGVAASVLIIAFLSRRVRCVHTNIVSTHSLSKKSLDLAARRAQQFGQRPQALPPQV